MSTNSTGLRHQVLFLPSLRKGSVDHGISLRDAARSLDEDIETICGGQGTCGKCKVRILENTFEEYGLESGMAHVSSLTQAERRHALKKGFLPEERLACQVRVHGPLVVFIPEESRLNRLIPGKTAGSRTINIIPTVRNHYIELPRSKPAEPLEEWERLSKALTSHFRLEQPEIDPVALQGLPEMLKQGKQKITVSLWEAKEIIRIQAGYQDKRYGLAIDLGTTTVVGFLCDLSTGEILATESILNPQIAYGEDVMTRIAVARDHEIKTRLHKDILTALGQLAERLCQQADLTSEDILEVVLVGNTVMHHLFLDLDVQPLGRAPFTPAVDHALNVKAGNLGFSILPSANVHLLPIEAAFVGADNVAVLIAEEPYSQDEILLIIDIGTNGELLLGNRQRLLSASCATGPAFEGGNITFGMRAAPGAIEKIRIDPETLDVRFKLIGQPIWHNSSSSNQVQAPQARGLCGSAVIDAVAELFAARIILGSGYMGGKHDSPRLRKGPLGKPEFVIAWAEETARGQDITLSQDDVRAIQLAKAAIYASAEIMLRRLETAKPDKILLAGAFGAEIDRGRALSLGMFPDCALENIQAIGNAAGDGARIALLNRKKRTEAERIARWVEYIELTSEPDFNDIFIGAIPLGHPDQK